jgi:hypothetical protein
MPPILRQAREGFLKIVLLGGLAALAGAPAPAWADELVVGALRDQDGRVVGGATVSAVDAAGAILASDRSAADGTFALTTATRPVAVMVRAADAEPLRLAVPADGNPLSGIVRRHRAADLIPSVADIAALPAGSPSELAWMIPYRVAFTSAISDRWLSRGRGVTTVQGLPFYRRGDGADMSSLLPAHALGTFGVHDSLQSPWYGDRASGGVLDGRLFDRTDAARATQHDGGLLLGRNSSLFTAASWDPDGARRLVAAKADGVVGPITANVVGLLGAAPGTHYAGTGAELRAATRTFDVGAHFALTASDSAITMGRNDGSVADAAFDVSGRGPNAIAVRARWRAERGELGIADAQHHDTALVFGTARGNVLRATAAVAFASGDDSSYDFGAAHGTAVLPSLSLDAPLGGGWSVHAGAAGSSLGTPGYGVARSSLAEAAIAFNDQRRIRAELVAFAEGDLAPTAVNRGLAASLGWEIAPRVSLRAWSLRDGDTLHATMQTYPGGPQRPVTVLRTFDRDVVWLTWDAPTRFDLLLRAKVLEGNVRIPLGARYALTAGSFVGRDAKRAVSVGLVAR